MNDHHTGHSGPSQRPPGLFGFDAEKAAEESDLAESRDLRDQVPDLVPYLLPFQRVVYLDDGSDDRVGRPADRPHPSSSRALMSLMGADRLQDIGNSGPGNAAEPLPEHQGAEQYGLLRALFGRDALHMGLQLYECFPRLLETTVIRLAELQGTTYNSAKEEEPGRIIHWAPDPEDPVALNITQSNQWEWPHYGSVDSTPMFVRGVLRIVSDNPDFLLTSYTGTDGENQTMSHALDAAVGWLEKHLEDSPDGLLEFQMHQRRGIWNQAWKDTPESYMHADGSYANHRDGIASIEVQVLAYDSLRDLARFYQTEAEGTRGDSRAEEALMANSSSIDSRAQRLKQTVLDKFWLEDERGGYFALGTDRDQRGNLRPLAVRTSNAGHALHLLDGDDRTMSNRRVALVRTLFSDELLDRNGIRTLSNREVRFAPRSYHCGSIWMWDNRAIALELDSSGYFALARDLDKRTLRVIETLGYFVEFVPGDNSKSASKLSTTRVIDVFDGERDHYANYYRIEKPAQETQAWTVAAIREIKRQNTPLHPELAARTVAIDISKREVELEVLERVAFPFDETGSGADPVEGKAATIV